MNTRSVRVTRNLLIASISIASPKAFAQKGAAPVQTALEPLSYTNAINVIVSLLIVLALLFAAAWVMRRSQHLLKPKAGHIHIASQLAIGVKDKVLLLKVGDENVLVGYSSGTMRALHTWQGELPNEPLNNIEGNINFLNLLQKQMNPKSNQGSDT